VSVGGNTLGSEEASSLTISVNGTEVTLNKKPEKKEVETVSESKCGQQLGEDHFAMGALAAAGVFQPGGAHPGSLREELRGVNPADYERYTKWAWVHGRQIFMTAFRPLMALTGQGLAPMPVEEVEGRFRCYLLAYPGTAEGKARKLAQDSSGYAMDWTAHANGQASVYFEATRKRAPGQAYQSRSVAPRMDGQHAYGGGRGQWAGRGGRGGGRVGGGGRGAGGSESRVCFEWSDTGKCSHMANKGSCIFAHPERNGATGSARRLALPPASTPKK
jgi:hypothetical protein